ncbi:protein of unknown function [Acidithiobacillus ferrivorans]|uniref:Uncharacterized protein n=1 Tax=Acidithiobacillus ferrivorans TaxID=160808 RepID=A0A060UQT5_9PROT|nr:hypothetical protein AFERRI_450005 [Acidithiobacillus ferrivorans]SMH64829.1 protein of unknown function [Acidithiobacillus ferrivorans]
MIARFIRCKPKGSSKRLFRDDSALSIDFDLVHTVVSQFDQVAPVFATFGLFGNARAHPYGLTVRLFCT